VSARGSEGNTLLEIAAVLGILGVLVTLTLSGFTQVRQDRLAEGVAWEVAQTLRHAQQLAVARSGEWRAVRVRFSDRVEVRGVWPERRQRWWRPRTGSREEYGSSRSAGPSSNSPGPALPPRAPTRPSRSVPVPRSGTWC
jgi:type II secretory pathway pseudopilin PulG